MNYRTVFLGFSCAVSLLIGAALGAQLAPEAGPAAAPVPSIAAENATVAPPVAVQLQNVAAQIDALAATLRDIEAELANDGRLREIAAELPTISRDVDARLVEHGKIMAQRPSLEILRALERGWQHLHENLKIRTRDLTQRVGALDQRAARQSELEGIWTATLDSLRNEAPREVLQRIESLLREIGRVRSALEAGRAEALRVQNRLAVQDTRVTQALAAVEARRDQTIDRVFEKDSSAIWNAALFERAGASVTRDAAHSLRLQLNTLQIYVEREVGRLVLHFALFVLLATVFWRLRRRIDVGTQNEPRMRYAALMFAMPIATALVLAAFTSRWAFPQAPRLLWAIIGVVALVPAVLILRRVVQRELVPVLYAIVIFYGIDQARAVAASLEAVPRLLLVGEMLGGALFLIWFLRALRRPGTLVDLTARAQLIRFIAWAALAFCVATGVSNMFGYVVLSNLLGNAVLSSAYFGVILVALVVILDGLVAVALSMRPLTLLGMVRQHKALLSRRIGFIVRAGALVLWVIFLLDRLAIRGRVVDAGSAVLTAALTLGSISISLGDILAFGVTVWAAFMLSNFVQFMLDEDIYPRARLRRGLPYAISRTLHYAILVTGFLLGVAALGFDMTKFTILVGAFTVGVGFGLQNIFNNFVSGLILLFERPVQVGDMIQMDDAAGIVDRIGIRASVVRTSSGSEIIVPNGKLISERLINWTFSSRRRGIELMVAVAHGAAPTRVMDLMNAAAAAHPDIIKSPPPQTMLTRLGPDWLGFELRAWTERIEDWVRIRSDLSVAVSESLAAHGVALK